LKKSDIIKSYIDNSTDKKVLFEIEFNNNKVDYLKSQNYLDGNIDGIINYLKLYDTKNTKYSNMNLFNHNNIITKYKNIYQIIEEFYLIRLNCYNKRKEYIINKLNDDLILIEMRVKYINDIIKKKLDIRNISINDLEQYLTDNEYVKLSLNKNSKVDYSYLIDMSIRSLTKEKVDLLNKQYDDKKKELSYMETITIENLYLNELNNL